MWIKTCGVNDIADAAAMRKDKFIKRYVLNSSVVREICSLILSSRIYIVTCLPFYFIFIQ